jgi:hypothetical protein
MNGIIKISMKDVGQTFDSGGRDGGTVSDIGEGQQACEHAKQQ